MSEKRFKIYQDSIRKFESNRIWGVKSETNSLEPYMTFKEAEKCCELLNEQQEHIERLQKIIDLTTYQLKVQDRIIQKMEEKE